MAIIIENDEYIDAMNANFCGGVAYTCEELQEYMNEKKRTVGQIEKWARDKQKDALDIRKALTVSKKVIKKASILH